MDNKNFEKLLREYGANNKSDELEKLIDNKTGKELCEYIEQRITHVDALPIWNYLLKSASSDKIFKMTQVILNKLKRGGVTMNHENKIIERLGSKICKFKTPQLLKLVDFCIESIQKFEVNNSMCWKDLLTKLLNILVTKDKIEHYDTEMTGTEYKAQIIKSLCVIKWSTNIVTSLAAMFVNIPLTKEEHLQVVNKLGKYMDGMTPQEIPAFTYQLLKLCENQNGIAVIMRLKDYFGKRLYIGFNKVGDSEETIFDENDTLDGTNNLEVIQAESTVLYHIQNSANEGKRFIIDYINSIKLISSSPESILHPFQIIVLLSISCVKLNETENVLDIIKYAITKSIIEDQKRFESAWFRDTVPQKVNLKLIFNTILDSNLQVRGMVVQGLINLAFCLLSTSPTIGRKLVAEKEWSLSYVILIKIVKKRSDVTPIILKELRNKILTEESKTQYPECFYKLCRAAAYEVSESQNIIVQIVEQLLKLSSTSAVLVIRSVLLLIKFSYNTRDSLVLVLSKALYSCDTSTRQIAIVGFLELLENLKVCNLVAFSQSESSHSNNSGRSILSQIISQRRRDETPTHNVHKNEVLCLEIIHILKRCLIMQSEVKMQLYEGLFNAISKNQELQTHGLDLLYSHFSKFYQEDENLPLNLIGIVQLKNTEAILHEPIAKLIFIIGLIVSKLKSNDDINIRSFTLLKEQLIALVNNMARCDVTNFELDNGTDLLDVLPESQQKLLELQQILLVYEALISYTIFSWDKKSDSGLQVLHLFKAYTRFMEFGKNLGKKKDTKRKKDDSVIKKTAQSGKTPVFKIKTHVITLDVIERSVSLLYLDSVEWATKQQSSHLRTNREFNRFILNTLLDLLNTTQEIKPAHDDSFENYMNIAKVIYTRCIKRIDDLADFDRQVASLSLEVFYTILNIVCTQYEKKLGEFLNEISDSTSLKTLSEEIFPFLETFENLLENEDVEADEEEGIRKNGSMILSIISLLTSHLPTSSVYTSQVLDWTKKVCDTEINCNKNTKISLLNLLYSLQMRCKALIQPRGDHENSLFDNVANQICSIIGSIDHESVEGTPTIKLINEEVGIAALEGLCNIFKSQLDDIDWIILRFRADYSMITFPGDDSIEKRRDKLRSNECDLCSHMCQLIEIATTMSNIAISSGGILEIVLKTLTHLYNTLGSLTKYFIVRSTKENPAFQHARFEKVIQLSGKYLSTNVYNMILFIEENQQPQENNDQPKAKKPKLNSMQLKSKVLKDTKFIPKLVYEIEQFSKFIIRLSNKTKIDLKKYMRQGTSRDFRIIVPALKEALENVNVDESIEDESVVDTNATESTINSDSDQNDDDN